jgi:plasmid stability protein
MASLTIRNIEEALKASLRIRAAEHGRSMEEEARQILRKSLVREKSSVGLGARIARPTPSFVIRIVARVDV